MNLITEFTTIPRLLRNVVDHIHDENETFLIDKPGSEWQEISYKKTLDTADAIAAYFLGSGIQKGDRLALLIENSPVYFSNPFRDYSFSGAACSLRRERKNRKGLDMDWKPFSDPAGYLYNYR